MTCRMTDWNEHPLSVLMLYSFSNVPSLASVNLLPPITIEWEVHEQALANYRGQECYHWINDSIVSSSSLDICLSPVFLATRVFSQDIMKIEHDSPSHPGWQLQLNLRVKLLSAKLGKGIPHMNPVLLYTLFGIMAQMISARSLAWSSAAI